MSFLGEIGVTGRIYALYRSEKLEKLDIVGSQYLYILRVCEYPGISQERLAKILLFNRSSVTRQVAALEKKGFLRRERYEADKRTYLIYPTEKALAAEPRIRKVSRAFRKEIAGDLTPEEMERLEDLLQKVNRRGREALE